jgi:hypothetical protein
MTTKTTIAVDKATALIQDLNANIRIAEYDCATKLEAGDLEGAKSAAKTAKTLRKLMMNMAGRILSENRKDGNGSPNS